MFAIGWESPTLGADVLDGVLFCSIVADRTCRGGAVVVVATILKSRIRVRIITNNRAGFCIDIPQGQAVIRELPTTGDIGLFRSQRLPAGEPEVLRHPASAVDVADGIVVIVPPIRDGEVGIRGAGLTISKGEVLDVDNSSWFCDDSHSEGVGIRARSNGAIHLCPKGQGVGIVGGVGSGSILGLDGSGVVGRNGSVDRSVSWCFGT